MTVRESTLEDIDVLMQLYADSHQKMIDSGNTHQWKAGYPSEELIRSEIASGRSHVIEDDGHIVGAFSFIIGPDPTYGIIEGAWLEDTRTYGTIHRLGSIAGAHGVAACCFDWCWNQLPNLRIDTHVDNLPMRHCIEKAGFIYCGVIHLLSGDPRIAFQKI